MVNELYSTAGMVKTQEGIMKKLKSTKTIVLIAVALVIATGGIYAMFGNGQAVGAGQEITVYYDQN